MYNKISTIIALIIKFVIVYDLITYAIKLNPKDGYNILVWIFLYLPMVIGYEWMIKTLVTFIVTFFNKKENNNE